MSDRCPKCGCEKIAMEKQPGCWFHCLDCQHSWQPYPVRFGFDVPPRKPTVFESITQSEETLAEKLVFPYTDGWEEGYWCSTIYGTDEAFFTKSEAIAATVAKLKEISR